jgi:hypothetical protein
MYVLIICLVLVEIEIFESKCMNEYVDGWTSQVNRENSRTAGGNKLRLYKRITTDIDVEHYVSKVMPYKHRSAMGKFRSGVAPIRLETGRYVGLPR